MKKGWEKKTKFSKILPNNQIITTCRIKLQVQEISMNEKLTMIGLSDKFNWWFLEFILLYDYSQSRYLYLPNLVWLYLPNGLIGNFSGPYVGKRDDSTMAHESGVLSNWQRSVLAYLIRSMKFLCPEVALSL